MPARDRGIGGRTARPSAAEPNPPDGASIIHRYFADIRRYPLLTRAQEQLLAERVREGCREALHALVEANLCFVARVANEYRGFGLPFEDLLNEGNIGLLDAAQRYDAHRGTRFVTYAIWWIRKSILRALNEHAGVVRIPSYQARKAREIRDAEHALQRALGRAPAREEISDRLERSVRKIDQVLQFSMHPVSLDERRREDDRPLADSLVDASSASPEEDLIRREAVRLVSEAFDRLGAREREVIAHRFGVSDGSSLTLKEVGALLALSRERVRQIERQAKARLRELVVRGPRSRSRRVAGPCVGAGSAARPDALATEPTPARAR